MKYYGVFIHRIEQFKHGVKAGDTYVTVSPAKSYSLVTLTELAAGCNDSELDLQAVPEHAVCAQHSRYQHKTRKLS